jgi:DNA topoisomerase VI subunit A
MRSTNFDCSPLRDIYYIDPAYFRSQQTVNGVVDDLAFTIGVDRAALNVVSPSLAHPAMRVEIKPLMAIHP